MIFLLRLEGGAYNFLRSEKGVPEKKNHANFTPENWVYVIFCGVDAYFPWGKRGPWKTLSPKGGPDFFCIRPPLQVFWTVLYDIFFCSNHKVRKWYKCILCVSAGDRTYAVTASRERNKLAINIRQLSSAKAFKKPRKPFELIIFVPIIWFCIGIF